MTSHRLSKIFIIIGFCEGMTVINAAKILAGTAFDLIDDSRLMIEVNQEFNETKARMSLA